MKPSTVRKGLISHQGSEDVRLSGVRIHVGDDDGLPSAQARPHPAKARHGVPDRAGIVPGERIGAAHSGKDQLLAFEDKDGRTRVAHQRVQVVEQKLQEAGQLQRRSEVTRRVEQCCDL
jgi:hypothetical protein